KKVGEIEMKLEVKDLRKSFGDTEVLHGISFSVESGKALGLLGRNGAGKTTTIRILMKVFNQSGGEVLLDGKEFNPTEYQIGYLPEERGLYPKKKVTEQLVFLAELRGMNVNEAKKNTKKWLERLGIEEYANRKLDTLSKGNQQKVQLAQTLVCDPDIVILDEPFSGLDPVNSQILKEVVRELILENKIVIFSSHQMSYVEEFCEDIAIINKGEIVLDGSLKEIKKEYGKNRLVLSANNYSVDELNSHCEHTLGDFVKVNEKKKDYLILELKEGKTKKDLLNKLVLSDIDIEKFSDYEPSLNDIFVEKVGDK
ncbi:MAG: ABC transporter ATP-binding protein, partial [Clostridium sp.]